MGRRELLRSYFKVLIFRPQKALEGGEGKVEPLTLSFLKGSRLYEFDMGLTVSS